MGEKYDWNFGTLTLLVARWLFSFFPCGKCIFPLVMVSQGLQVSETLAKFHFDCSMHVRVALTRSIFTVANLDVCLLGCLMSTEECGKGLYILLYLATRGKGCLNSRMFCGRGQSQTQSVMQWTCEEFSVLKCIRKFCVKAMTITRLFNCLNPISITWQLRNGC